MIIKYLKKNMPNIYQIIVALSIALWFDGINMITHSLVKPGRNTGIIFVILALLVFYLDDGSLNELHNIETVTDEEDDTNNYAINNNKKRNRIAAIMAAAANRR